MTYKNGEEIKVGDLVRGMPRDSAHEVMGVVCGIERVGNDNLVVIAAAAIGSATTKHAMIGKTPVIVHRYNADAENLELVWRQG